MDDRELARAQEPGKCPWAHAQPPLRFCERNQLRRRGDLQGEVLLPRGRACARARGRLDAGGMAGGSPLKQQGVRHGGATRTADPNGLGRHRGDSAENLC